MKNLAKPFVLFTVVITLLLIASCSNDDGTIPEKVAIEKPEEKSVEQPTEPPAEEPPSSEESNKIIEGVNIKGSTKVEGVPPTPNEAINMDLSGADTDAYLNEGFNVPIVSDADIVGAYIQFKAKDAGVSESYYNVNLTENNLFDVAKAKRRNIKTGRYVAPTSKSSNTNLDVDFGPDITPGEFCYLICTYDADGNISAPQEVCITVNAWGGNDALVGTWKYIKDEGRDEAGTLLWETLVGTEYCYVNNFTCSNDQNLEFTHCSTQEYSDWTFNADGTYTWVYSQFGNSMDYETSDVDCELVYEDFFFKFTINGNWSYDEETKRLVTVEYSYNSENQNGSYDMTYDAGTAYVYPIDGVKVDNEMWSWGYDAGDDLNGDGIIDSGYRKFHERQ